MTWQEEKLKNEIVTILKRTIAQGYPKGTAGYLEKKDLLILNNLTERLNNIKTKDFILAAELDADRHSIYLSLNKEQLFTFDYYHSDNPIFEELNIRISKIIQNQMSYPTCWKRSFTMDDADKLDQLAAKFRDLILQKDQVIKAIKSVLALFIFSKKGNEIKSAEDKRFKAFEQRIEHLKDLINQLDAEYKKEFIKNLAAGDEFYYCDLSCKVININNGIIFAKKANGHKFQIDQEHMRYVYPDKNLNEQEELQEIKDLLPQLNKHSIYELRWL